MWQKSIYQKNEKAAYLIQQLQISGLRLYDSLTLFPVAGKKQKIVLSRTSIYLLGSNQSDEDYQGKMVIRLPTLQHENLSVTLSLANLEKGTIEENGRYILKSNNNRPFSINGNWAFESFVERGDRVYIGHNCLNFEQIVGPHILSDLLLSLDNINLDKVAPNSLPVLIEGETGIGKGHLAKLIHGSSNVAGRFVQINLSSFAPNLIESELFGHVKGAFTGACADKSGAFLEAKNGTLFIDEIDSLPFELQVKLLLFLDNQSIRPVGGKGEISCPTRVIFASGRNLRNLVSRNEFRKDLYFRLGCGHLVELKPLRFSPEKIRIFCDILCISEDFSIHHKLVDFYCTLPWPGNIRQLRGHLHKKLVLSNKRKLIFDELDQELLISSSDLKNIEEDGLMTIDCLKKNYAQRILQQFNGDLKQTANVLDVTPRTLKMLLAN